MNRAEARGLFPELRDAARLSSGEWCESYNLEEKRSEICVRAGAEVLEPIAVILEDCGYDDRRLMIKAPRLVRAAVTLLAEAREVIAGLRQEVERLSGQAEGERRAAATGHKADFARECAMKCDDTLFRRFLEESHALKAAATMPEIATRVRSILAIRSRSELNTDRDAAARWVSLRAEFDAWRKR